MRVFYSAKSRLHNPLYEINNGEKVPHPENAKRVDVILDALTLEGFRVEEVSSRVPLSLLTQIHSREFLQFVKFASSTLKKDEHLYPDVFLRERVQNLKNILAQMGRYSFDTYTPITNGTYPAAIAAASVAFRGAREVANGEKNVYVLTHPIGHHSLPDKMGGYSYFNNAAIAAQFLSGFGSVAILDLDLHHGNGTQEIFYERSDVLFVSIHADPNFKFPYYYGFKEERGENQGLGFNINYPLPLRTENEVYQKTLVKALREIRKFGPKFLVISLGFDTYKDDPIGAFKLTTDYYGIMAKTISELGLKTLIVQEGGYDLSALGKNIASFLKAYESFDFHA